VKDSSKGAKYKLLVEQDLLILILGVSRVAALHNYWRLHRCRNSVCLDQRDRQAASSARAHADELTI
jgi:hypothetical protein